MAAFTPMERYGSDQRSAKERREEDVRRTAQDAHERATVQSGDVNARETMRAAADDVHERQTSVSGDAASEQEAAARPAAETSPRGKREKKRQSKEEREREQFDLSETLHDIREKYRPEFLAKGGEHLVYRIPSSPGVVAKIDVNFLRRFQNFNVSKKRPLNELSPELSDAMKGVIQENRERLLLQRQYFGRERVLAIKQVITKIPMTPGVLEHIHRLDVPKGAKDATESWALVKIQKTAPEIADPSHETIAPNYAEMRSGVPHDAYERVTEAYVSLKEGAEVSDADIEAMGPADFVSILKRCETDQDLRETISDFTARAIRMTNDTGEMLDLAGSDNVTLFKKDGKWQYRLVDAVYPGGADVLEKAADAVSRAAKGEELGPNDAGYVLNAVNYVRSINLMAARLGLKDRIAWMPKEAEGKVDFLKLLKG
ncbi:MAG: hypothetical protein RLZZ324_952 [Candidatus Parcubacteria bacterium]